MARTAKPLRELKAHEARMSITPLAGMWTWGIPEQIVYSLKFGFAYSFSIEKC